MFSVGICHSLCTTYLKSNNAIFRRQLILKLLTKDIYGLEALAPILAFLNHFSKILKLIKILGLIYRPVPLRQVPKVRLPIGDLVLSYFSLSGWFLDIFLF